MPEISTGCLLSAMFVDIIRQFTIVTSWQDYIIAVKGKMRRRVTLSTRSEQIAMFTISRGLMITMLLLCLTWTTSASPALPPPPPPAPTPPPSLATPHPQPRSISTINRQPAPSHPFFTLFGSTGPALKTPRTGRTQTIQKLGMATMKTMASGAKLLTLMTSIPRRCSSSGRIVNRELNLGVLLERTNMMRASTRMQPLMAWSVSNKIYKIEDY